jgi:GNAT superfamily N-acetyltransferase
MLTIRGARPEDAGLIRQLIRELAEYERAPEAAVITEVDILRDGFGERPFFEVLIAEWSGQPAGFAFYFFVYSTWQGRPSLYLEDLFVRPAVRGHGIGSALVARLARLATEKRCGRMVWQVLDWNEPSIRFYEGLGARRMSEWLTMRLEGDALQRLASRA